MATKKKVASKKVKKMTPKKGGGKLSVNTTVKGNKNDVTTLVKVIKKKSKNGKRNGNDERNS